MKKLLIIVFLVGLIGGALSQTGALSQINYKPLYRPYTIKEAQDMYKAKGMEHVIEALKYLNFASTLDCPCYDVEISSAPDHVRILVNTDRCPEVTR